MLKKGEMRRIFGCRWCAPLMSRLKGYPFWRMLFLVSFSAVFFILLFARFDFVNGPWYWEWGWRDLSFFHTALVLCVPFALVLFVVHYLEKHKRNVDVLCVLVLLTVSTFLFQMGGVLAEPSPHTHISRIITSDMATGYFTDAYLVSDVEEFLSSFHRLSLQMHPSVHPPGVIFYHYAFVQLFDYEKAAFLAGLGIAFLASLSVIVMYFFSGLWVKTKHDRLFICALYSMIPSLVLFYPMFDQVYPIFSMLTILFWELAIRRDRRYIFPFAFMLFMLSFFSYSLLMIGTFIALSGLFYLYQHRSNFKTHFSYLVYLSSVAILLWWFVYLVLYFVYGFEPFLTFFRSLENHYLFVPPGSRPYSVTVFFDVYDFFVGSGIVTFPLLVLYLKDSFGKLRHLDYATTLSYIGLLTILVVDLTGLLRSETLRLWIFLQPLILVPAGIVFSRLLHYEKYAVVAILWLTVVAIKSNFYFVW